MKMWNAAMTPERIIPSDPDSYDEYLGELTPPVGSYPNLVLPARARSLRNVAKVTGCKIAWWANAPDDGLDGGEMVELDVRKHPAIWASKANQNWLMAHGGFAKLGHFTFLFNASLKAEVLDGIETELPADMTPIIDSVWPAIAKRMPHFEWVYFPFHDESDLAMFVADKNQTRLVEKLQTTCDEDGIPTGRAFVGDDGNEGWHLNDQLREMA